MAQTVQNEFNQQYAAPGERKGGSGYIFYPGNFITWINLKIYKMKPIYSDTDINWNTFSL